jgi:hypothetical protein
LPEVEAPSTVMEGALTAGRTYRHGHDLRAYFQWAADVGVAVLAATRPHIESYRGVQEQRGLAASTIDRRLTTGVWLLPLRPHRRPHPIAGRLYDMAGSRRDR